MKNFRKLGTDMYSQNSTCTEDPPHQGVRRESQVPWQESKPVQPATQEKKYQSISWCPELSQDYIIFKKLESISNSLTTKPSCSLSPMVNFRGSIERIWGKVMGEECIVIYLDSRAPILVFSGFLCHLRQTKVKCFCLVNISVIWTAAFPRWGTGGFSQMPISQIPLYKHMVL